MNTFDKNILQRFSTICLKSTKSDFGLNKFNVMDLNVIKVLHVAVNHVKWIKTALFSESWALNYPFTRTFELSAMLTDN